MPVISGGHIIEGSAEYSNPGAPSAGTSAVDTLDIDADGGTFTLKYGGQETADIAWNATNATLIANVGNALRALFNIGAGNVAVAAGTLTAGIGTMTITFQGALVRQVVKAITVGKNELTGTATLTVTRTTDGVNADAIGASKGALLRDTVNGILYINTGADGAPVWTKVGTQT